MAGSATTCVEAVGGLDVALRTLVDCEVAPIAEDDCVSILPLTVVAYGTCRILGGEGEVRLRNVLGLIRVSASAAAFTRF